MKKPSLELPVYLDSGQKQSILVGNAIIVLMMVSLGIGLAQLGVRVFPGWRGAYVPWVCLFVALEAIYTSRRIEAFEGRERWFFRISEWIAIGVIIKILQYLINGPAQLLEDILLWQEDFIGTFFNAEYLVVIGLSLLVWFSAAAYSSELTQLYDRERDSDWEDLGKLQNMIHAIRDRMSARIFVIGALVVALAVFARVDSTTMVRMFGEVPPGYYSPVINVLFYFLLALVLLSQTQFALLRTRWLWQHMPISPEIARNWIKFGLLSFLVLVVIVFFLPTEYSVGLLDTLRIVLNFFMQAVTLLVMLITLPLTFCLSLLNFTTTRNGQTPAEPITPQVMPAQPPADPVQWLEFVRSLFFWAVFLGVIFFAFRFYFQQNTALWNAIMRFPLFSWLGDFLGAAWGWLRGARHHFAGLVETGIKRLRARRVSLPTQVLRRVFNLARMNPREKIVFFYLNLVELGGERGLVRRPSQTPHQYQERISQALPEIDPELHDLTEEFYTARYSPQPIDEPEAQKASTLWERIKAILKNWQRPDER